MQPMPHGIALPSYPRSYSF